MATGAPAVRITYLMHSWGWGEDAEASMSDSECRRGIFRFFG